MTPKQINVNQSTSTVNNMIRILVNVYHVILDIVSKRGIAIVMLIVTVMVTAEYVCLENLLIKIVKILKIIRIPIINLMYVMNVLLDTTSTK